MMSQQSTCQMAMGYSNALCCNENTETRTVMAGCRRNEPRAFLEEKFLIVKMRAQKARQAKVLTPDSRRRTVEGHSLIMGVVIHIWVRDGKSLRANTRSDRQLRSANVGHGTVTVSRTTPGLRGTIRY